MYNKTTHSLISRINPRINPTLKQGFVFSSAGAGCLNYGVRNLITGSTTKMRWQFQLNTVAGAGTTRRICSEYNSTGNKRGWQWYISVENVLTIVVGNNGGTASAYGQAITGCTPESGDYFDITFNAGVFTVVKNGTTTYTQNRSATQIAIYNNNSPNLNVGGYLDSASTSYNGSMCCFKIWVDNILDTDTPKFVAPMGDKTGRDIISGTKPAVVGTVNMSALSDTASFRAEEYGFAVKSGEIFLKNYSGSGYAGLVGTADKYFPRGLISRRGSIDIEAWNYLDTLIDFGGSSGVLSAGIIINQFDGTDCNDDLITTAEPKLDPAEIAILIPASGDDIELDKNFTVSGTSNCANVKIEASADGTTWVTLAASVAVSSGAFSKSDCQLPSADFDPNDEVTIRVSDVDAISYPDTVEIDVASSIVAIQFGGTSTDLMSFCEEQSDGSFVVVGRTKSSTLFGVNTYASGLTRDNTKYAVFVNRLNSDGTQFSGFTPFFIGGCTNAGGATDTDQINAASTYGVLGLVLSTSIYVIITAGTGGTREGIFKLSLSTGSVEASRDLTNQSTNEPFAGIITDGTYIYTFGSKDTSYSPRPTVWRYPLDLSSETILINTSDDSGSAARSCSVCGTKLVFSSANGTHRYTLAGVKEEYNTTIKIGSNYGGFNLGSASRWYVHSTSDAKIYCYAVSDFSALWNQAITNTAQGLFRVLDNGNMAMAQRKAGTPDSFDLTVFQDANSYTNISATSTAVDNGVISFDVKPLNKGGLSGRIDGKLVSDSTDAGDYDCFVYKE